MKKGIKILTVLMLIFTQSCESDSPMDCFTPPVGLYFELIDEVTGENLFTNGTYTSDQIEVINIENGESVAFSFIDENDYNVFSIDGIGWATEVVNYSINISDKSIFELYVDSELYDEGCVYSFYNEIRIDNSEYELDSESGIYKILTK